MKGLNKAYLIGNIGQDPELRTTANGKVLVKLSLATPNSRKVGDEWVETPDWHRLTGWEKTADFLATYARKGDVLAVECAIRPRKWTDKDNVVHYEIDLVIDRVLWLNGKHRGASSNEGAMHALRGDSGAGSRTPPRTDADGESETEQIPF
ncbi:MAG: single-stranded DNA-binding protein [Pseudomonadota bacterium]|nr:single-stranded DNA-binding protein [Pseudomonadota bacterium]